MSSRKLDKYVHKPRTRDCLDRISSLRDEVLGYLLSFLPTSCAVSTSILSKRWRYLFTLTNCLSFDDEPSYFGTEINYEVIEAAQQRWFKKFVYNVLELNQISTIKKFSLACTGIYYESDLDAWFSKAVLKEVQEIHYEFANQEDGLPNSLFTCETLVSLKIKASYWSEPKPFLPVSFSLPRLKILHLGHVMISCHPAASFCILAGVCEFLEELTLKFCDSDNREYNTGSHIIISFRLLKVLTIQNCSFKEDLLEIDAPNLAYLSYRSKNTGVKIIPSWKYSSSLVKAELEFIFSTNDASNHSLLQHDRGLVKSAAAYKATDLRFIQDSFELLLKVDDQEQMHDFPNLSRLRVCHCPYFAWNSMTSLLKKSPQLETVKFESCLHRCCDPESPPLEALIPFSCEAKVIEVFSFCGHECSLILLGHLLRNARVLKKLILGKKYSISMEEELRISKAVLMPPRASAECCIELI